MLGAPRCQEQARTHRGESLQLALVVSNVRLGTNQEAPLRTCVPSKDCDPVFDIVLDGSPESGDDSLAHRRTLEFLSASRPSSVL